MTAFLALADRRRKEEALIALEVNSLAAQGSQKAINAEIKRLRKELG